MGWEPEIEELHRRGAFAEQLGGADKVKRQHDFGKLTVRERIERVIDPGTLHEIGKTAGIATYDDEDNLVDLLPSNFVFGLCEIDGRPAVISGDDFTVRGGSSDAALPAKRTASETLALTLRLPHVRLIDGMGGGGSVKTIEQDGYAKMNAMIGWNLVSDQLNVAPSIALALGSVAGLGAARVATSHYSIIVRDTAQMMIAGPALVEWASLGDAAKEELGHADIHTSNGAIDDVAASEDEAFAMVRRFLSYFPSSVDEVPPRATPTDHPHRREEALLSIVPRESRQVYKMRQLLELVVDREPGPDGAGESTSLFEVGRRWGKSIITGLARLDGYPVAIFAEDPYIYGGGWTAEASRKLTRFADLASTFHLPLIHLEDCPGFVIGKQSEQDGAIRFGSAALVALQHASVPYACIIIRKAYGVAGASNNVPGRHAFRSAWPSGDWGSLPLEGGIEVGYKAELAAAPDRELRLKEIKAHLDRLRSPQRAAEVFAIEEIIDPRDTRPLLCEWVRLAQRALPTGPPSFGFRP